jgi:hypothetical protein
MEKLEKEAEEESARLERGLDSLVNERKSVKKRNTEKDEMEQIIEQLGDSRGHAGGWR